jgi:group I intron endonuclease
MPYAEDSAGVYKLVNKVTGQCYVGQSQKLKKRIAEHFRHLRRGIHPNPRLQNAFNKYGESAFYGEVEVVCEDVKDLDTIENAFLSGEAFFVEPVVYNIADFAKAPMRGNRHSEEVRQRIRAGRRATTFDYRSEEYRKTLSDAQTRRFLSDPKFVAKVQYIVDNPDMTYAARGRALGIDTSSVRKLSLRYAHLKGTL